MKEFKSSVINALNSILISLAVILTGFIIWVILIAGIEFFFKMKASYALLLSWAYFIYSVVAIRQTIYFTDKKLIIKNTFYTRETEYSTIKSIVERSIGLGDFETKGIIVTKNTSKKLYILEYKFKKDWKEIVKILKSKSKKKIEIKK